jgi:hypothetical protein
MGNVFEQLSGPTPVLPFLLIGMTIKKQPRKGTSVLDVSNDLLKRFDFPRILEQTRPEGTAFVRLSARASSVFTQPVTAEKYQLPHTDDARMVSEQHVQNGGSTSAVSCNV